ncbi:MAG TPA: hypothetical protein VMV92_31205 [Streptosporangiaceae bacterium]|nr:hypothetical protein [Streptosporangiaceae bacterium]
MMAGQPGRAGRVPGGPVEVPPPGFVPGGEQAEILAAALAGVELGVWDRRILGWLAGWDASTVLTVASWIVRSRAAGPAR